MIAISAKDIFPIIFDPVSDKGSPLIVAPKMTVINMMAIVHVRMSAILSTGFIPPIYVFNLIQRNS